MRIQRRSYGPRPLRFTRVVLALLVSSLVLVAMNSSGGPGFSATPTAANPSGQSEPSGNLADFVQVFRSDFSQDAPSGSFLSTYRNWGAYPNTYSDTCRHGTYEPANLSVAGGMLHLNLQPGHGNAPYPIPSTGWDRLYGRYDVRFQSDSAANYHAAWLLWPQSEVWPGDGEIDFPEADLNATVNAFMHRQNGANGGDQDAYGSNTRFGDGAWHTASTIWKPNDLTLLLDGQVIGHSTSRVPNTPMHWIIQTEVGCSAPTQNADVRIAWATVYDYRPGTTAAGGPTSAPTPTAVAPSPRPLPSGIPTAVPQPTLGPTPVPTPSPSPGGVSARIDDTAVGTASDQISYAHWGSEMDSGDYGASDHFSYRSGAVATIHWTGTQLSIQGWKAPNFGIGAIATDGRAAVNVDWFDSAYPHQQTIYATPVLAPGPHVTTITVTGYHDQRSPGTMITVDSFVASGVQAPTATTVKVDDSAASATTDVDYSGWATESDPGDFGGGDHYSYATGATATVHWSGTQLSIVGWKAPNFGVGSIATDGVAPAFADWYSASYPHQQTIYSTPVLADGPHVTVITVTGYRDAASPGTMITLDACVIHRGG